MITLALKREGKKDENEQKQNQRLTTDENSESASRFPIIAYSNSKWLPC